MRQQAHTAICESVPSMFALHDPPDIFPQNNDQIFTLYNGIFCRNYPLFVPYDQNTDYIKVPCKIRNHGIAPLALVTDGHLRNRDITVIGYRPYYYPVTFKNYFCTGRKHCLMIAQYGEYPRPFNNGNITKLFVAPVMSLSNSNRYKPYRRILTCPFKVLDPLILLDKAGTDDTGWYSHTPDAEKSKNNPYEPSGIGYRVNIPVSHG